MPLDGLPQFLHASRKVLFGEEILTCHESRIASLQCLSGTGSLRIAGEFLHKFFPNSTIYIPATTWENHWKVFEAAGMQTASYRYLDHTGYQFAFNELIEDISNIPDNSIVLLHMVGHNPSGVDPTNEQWEDILAVIQQKNLFPLLDNAYQGFISGNHHVDAYVARRFIEVLPSFIVASSFAKNFGLYGERIGALHVVTAHPNIAKNCLSQLKIISRVAYSNCPAYGARIIAEIVNDDTLFAMWQVECKAMADRLISVRRLLVECLKSENVKGNWDHIQNQKGMFSFTGISAEVVIRLRKEYSIYMLETGRLSLAGLNTNNTLYFAQSLGKILGKNS